ncbi:MAG: ASKHA domain-containing protein [Treponema sp.]|nr:ASKHA domain-containing protein [Treponema sp.]
MPNIIFIPGDIKADIPAGTSLLEAARLAGVFVETPCGGKGTCRKCRVQITAAGITKEALICQTTIGNDPVTVELPAKPDGEGQFENFENPSKYLPVSKESFLRSLHLSVALPALLDGLSDADRFTKALKKTADCRYVDLPLNVLAVLPETLRETDGEVLVHYFAGNNTAKVVNIRSIRHSTVAGEKTYGIAVDIGTTTVALWLAVMEDGKVISARSAYNDQVECGLDVISRINYAKKFLPELRSRIVKTINELIVGVCKDAKIETDRILCVSLAGNTTMTHLLLGINPEYIRLFPYTPAVFIPQTYTAGQAGIAACKDAPVLFAPAVGSYVGGDITAGLLCTSLAAGVTSGINELVLFIDIGTNGEIVLGNSEFIFACACSAGPAFEGGGIKHGVRARTGAIERVVIGDTGKPEVYTIGGAPPTGICGSGIISAVAELFRKGIIDQAGKFPEKNGEYLLCEGITISETDIDNFIRAKGAVFSACQTMLESVSFSFADVDQIYVAGGFGRFLDLEDARTIGLLPRLPDEKYTFLGNSSVIGAYLTMVSKEHRTREHELAGKITYMDLSSEPRYMDHYTAALFLPHTDRKLFE